MSKNKKIDMPKYIPDYVTVYSIYFDYTKTRGITFLERDLRKIAKNCAHQYVERYNKAPEKVLMREGRNRYASVNIYPYAFRLTILNEIAKLLKGHDVTIESANVLKYLEEQRELRLGG